MNDLNRHRQKAKMALQATLNLPEAHLLENRYRTIRSALFALYPNLITNTDKEVMLNFLKDTCYLDRILRLETQGEEKEKKTIASQKFQLEEVGMEVNYHQRVKQLHENKI